MATYMVPSYMMEPYEKENSLLNSIIQQYYTKNDYWMALLVKEGEREGEQTSMISRFDAAVFVCSKM